MATKKGQLRKSIVGEAGPRPFAYMTKAQSMAKALTKPRKKYEPKNTKWGKKQIARLARANTTIKNLKEKVATQSGPLMGTTLAISGGAIAGIIEAKIPNIAGKVSTNMTIGAVGVLAGIFADFPHSDKVLCISTGMLAKWSGDLAEDMASGAAPTVALVGAAQ